MAGIFPGISALCMTAREKVFNHNMRRFLFFLGSLQLLAWAGDITENLYLIKWVRDPVIGNDFAGYHIIVTTKWVIALIGFMISFVTAMLRFKVKPR